MQIEEINATLEENGYVTEWAGTPTVGVLGLRFDNGYVIGVDTATVCVYTKEAWDGGTEEFAIKELPVHLTPLRLVEEVREMASVHIPQD